MNLGCAIEIEYRGSYRGDAHVSHLWHPNGSLVSVAGGDLTNAIAAAVVGLYGWPPEQVVDQPNEREQQ